MKRQEKGPRVALATCASYEPGEVERALDRAVGLLGGWETIFQEGDGRLPYGRDSLLLLKPNLLAKAAPEEACTTHPAVFQAAGALLQKAGYGRLVYGDSPGNPMIKVEKVAEGCGIKEAADALEIPLGDFERGRSVEFSEGRATKSFVLCDGAVEADGIINLCKMKTHQLERITGAMKNTFGCVYGINKGASHARFATAEVFAKMIADLNNLVRPKLHIMDGIVAMEGNGPRSGRPKKMGLLLVSTDPVALDALFCHLVDLKPELVPTNVTGRDQGVGSWEDMEVLTGEGVLTPRQAAEKYGDSSFSVQRSSEFRGNLRPVRFLAPLLQKKPVVREDVCIGCGICREVCPVPQKAITLTPIGGKTPHGAGRGAADTAGAACADSRKIARYDYDKCIKCYCCQELCPKQAITVKKSLLARIADRNWRL